MFNEWEIPLNIWTHYLPSTSQPILRRSHHRSRHGDAPAPPCKYRTKSKNMLQNKKLILEGWGTVFMVLCGANSTHA